MATTLRPLLAALLLSASSAARAGYAFGLPSRYHTCDALPRSEVFIYPSPAKCQAALETMQSNGP